MYSLVASVGLHFDSCIYWVFYIIKYYMGLPSKYILNIIDSNSVMLRLKSRLLPKCNKVQQSAT